MRIPFCINLSVSRLLGEIYHHSGTEGHSSVHSYKFTKSHEPRMDALEKAKRTFQKWSSGRYRQYASVLARLAEALARSGRFAMDDKILDVAITLGRLYELDKGEIVYKLKTRVACFLETDTKSRMQVFKDIDKFYQERSAIMHNRTDGKSNEKKIASFEKGFDVVRRSLFKLLRDGPPSNWNELVVAGTDT